MDAGGADGDRAREQREDGGGQHRERHHLPRLHHPRVVQRNDGVGADAHHRRVAERDEAGAAHEQHERDRRHRVHHPARQQRQRVALPEAGEGGEGERGEDGERQRELPPIPAAHRRTGNSPAGRMARISAITT